MAAPVSIRHLTTTPLRRTAIEHVAVAAYSDVLVASHEDRRSTDDPCVVVYNGTNSSSIIDSGYYVVAVAVADEEKIFVAEVLGHQPVQRSIVLSRFGASYRGRGRGRGGGRCELASGDVRCVAVLAAPSSREVLAFVCPRDTSRGNAPTARTQLVVVDADDMVVTRAVDVSLSHSAFPQSKFVLSPDGRLLAVLQLESRSSYVLSVFDLEQRRDPACALLEPARVTLPSDSLPLSLSFSPDGSRLAVGRGATVLIISVPLLSVVRTIKLERDLRSVCYVCSHRSPNEALLVGAVERRGNVVALSEDGRELASSEQIGDVFDDLLVDKRGVVTCIGDDAHRFAIE
jgi:hypothetical protein